MTGGRAPDFLRALEIFLMVAECRSMTAAAKTLGIAQSAVSQTLQQLEAELEQALFDRAVRPLALTSAGALLRGRAVQLVANAAETRIMLRDIGRGAMPHLRLAVIASLAGTLVPPLVGALTDRLGITEISVWRGVATTSENALIRREVDMLVTSDALYDVNGLERLPLFDEPYIVVVPPMALTKSADNSLAGLAARLPFIRYTRRTQMGWAIESQLKRMGAEISGRLEFDSNEDVIAMVAAGEGWAVTVPSHVLHGLRGKAGIDSMPFPGPAFRRSVNLVVRAAELGSVPDEVQRLCRDVLATDFAAGIAAVVPWLGDRFRIAERV